MQVLLLGSNRLQRQRYMVVHMALGCGFWHCSGSQWQRRQKDAFSALLS